MIEKAKRDDCCRAPYWEELSIADKIEALAKQLEIARAELEGFNRKAFELLGHKHCEGKVVVAVKEHISNLRTRFANYLNRKPK